MLGSDAMCSHVTIFPSDATRHAPKVGAGRFAMGQLVEVNAHSLFSKWFSESGKLVSRLFAKIGELVRCCSASVVHR